jgi:hypothetical protein
MLVKRKTKLHRNPHENSHQKYINLKPKGKNRKFTGAAHFFRWKKTLPDLSQCIRMKVHRRAQQVNETEKRNACLLLDPLDSRF